MASKRIFSAPGKIILSGEYAVIFGFPGVAVPSSLKLTASYQASEKDLTIEWEEKNLDAAWITFVKKIVELLEKKLGKQFGGTLRIENELPLGKGMGSSTALVIAVTRAFGGAREIALEVENEVNPGHSGLDFAVIWENAPVLFQKGSTPMQLKLPEDLLKGAFLLDTGTPNESTPELVGWMKEKYNDPQTKGAIKTIDACTERLLTGESLADVMRDHHRAQLQLGVVPEKTAALIAAIENEGGSAKVIGAGGRTGGGGMVLVLGIAENELTSLARQKGMPFYSI